LFALPALLPFTASSFRSLVLFAAKRRNAATRPFDDSTTRGSPNGLSSCSEEQLYFALRVSAYFPFSLPLVPRPFLLSIPTPAIFSLRFIVSLSFDVSADAASPDFPRARGASKGARDKAAGNENIIRDEKDME